MTATLSKEELAALDAVVARATQGEWLSHSRYEESAAIPFSINGKSIGLCWCESLDGTKFDCEANAAAIVALHNAYPALRAIIDVERAMADAAAAHERAAIVAWLREQACKSASEARDVKALLENVGRIKCKSHEAAYRFAASFIERGDHRSNDHG
jgi:hypothetical protein